MMDRGDHFRLVETLSEEEYLSGHLPGAVHLPPDRIRENADEVLPDKEERIVLYCLEPGCAESRDAAGILEEIGYEDVIHYEGGKEAWREAGYPLEGREA